MTSALDNRRSLQTVWIRTGTNVSGLPEMDSVVIRLHVYRRARLSYPVLEEGQVFPQHAEEANVHMS